MTDPTSDICELCGKAPCRRESYHCAECGRAHCNPHSHERHRLCSECRDRALGVIGAVGVCVCGEEVRHFTPHLGRVNKFYYCPRCGIVVPREEEA